MDPQKGTTYQCLWVKKYTEVVVVKDVPEASLPDPDEEQPSSYV